ncbi:DUF7096 domain-containing protein [Haloplanus halobius]|uniref:DUF7096 domain-containing protein n=1 Tax=Haloplanus halobius TaxID=2934938 RepID=UPI00200FE381|nr:hypothetical protein [Haloplanus sp. XH21]
MNREVPDVVVFALVVAVAVGMVAAPVSALTTDRAGVAPQTTATAEAGGNESASNESLAPGQRLAGVVGVQGAEIDGELEERTFEARVSRARSNASKAAVVATEVNDIRDRLQTLRERQERLREAYQSGNISTGEYHARMAVTSAELRTVRNQIDSNERVARDLPEAALEARGVNRTELDRLRNETNELQGPEVAALARQIAGPPANRGPRNASATAGQSERPADIPVNAGPPATARNQSTDRSANASNRSTRGPPADAGTQSANRSTRGPPSDAGANETDDTPGNGADGDGESGDRGASDGADSGSDGAGSGNGNSPDDRGNADDSGNAGGGGSNDGDNAGSSGDPNGNGNGNSDNGDRSNRGGGR